MAKGMTCQTGSDLDSESERVRNLGNDLSFTQGARGNHILSDLTEPATKLQHY